jgi:hypothetical protein
MDNIYSNQAHLKSNLSWHDEDSPWKASQVMALLARTQFDTSAARARLLVKQLYSAGG